MSSWWSRLHPVRGPHPNLTHLKFAQLRSDSLVTLLFPTVSPRHDAADQWSTSTFPVKKSTHISWTFWGLFWGLEFPKSPVEIWQKNSWGIFRGKFSEILVVFYILAITTMVFIHLRIPVTTKITWACLFLEGNLNSSIIFNHHLFLLERFSNDIPPCNSPNQGEYVVLTERNGDSFPASWWKNRSNRVQELKRNSQHIENIKIINHGHFNMDL